jgi:hypothetical protein
MAKIFHLLLWVALAFVICGCALLSNADRITTNTEIKQRRDTRKSYVTKATKAYSTRLSQSNERRQLLLNEEGRKNGSTNPTTAATTSTKGGQKAEQTKQSTTQAQAPITKSATTPTPSSKSTQSSSSSKFTKPHFNFYKNRAKSQKDNTKALSNYAKLHSSPQLLAKARHNLHTVATWTQKATQLGFIDISPEMLKEFISMDVRPFVTVVSITADGLYPPQCQTCRSFHNTAVDFAQYGYKRQQGFWNATVVGGNGVGSKNNNNNDNGGGNDNGIGVVLPSTFDEMLNPTTAITNPANNAVIFIQLDFGRHRDVLLDNKVMSAPFSFVIGPSYDHGSGGVGELFIQNAVGTRITTGASHSFTYQDYTAAVQHLLPSASSRLLDLSGGDNRLRNAMGEISIWVILIPTWILVTLTAIILSNLYTITQYRLLKWTTMSITISLVLHFLSGPSILKESKSNKSSSTPPIDIASILKDGTAQSYWELILQFTAQAHTWYHHDSRDAYTMEIYGVWILLFTLTTLIVLLITIARNRDDNLGLTIDCTRQLAGKRMGVVLEQKRGWGTATTNENDDQNANSNSTATTTTTTPTPSSSPNPSAFATWPLRLLPYALSNLLVPVLIIIIIFVGLSYQKAFELKNQFIMDAYKAPIKSFLMWYNCCMGYITRWVPGLNHSLVNKWFWNYFLKR